MPSTATNIDRLALLLEALGLGQEPVQVDAALGHELAVARAGCGRRRRGASTPWPGMRAKLSALGHVSPRSWAAPHDRLAQGVLAVLSAMAASREAPRPARPVADRRHDVGHRRLALGQGAGLVEDDGLCSLAVALDGLGALEEDAVLGGLAGAGHHGAGRRQAHGARAGDDQHRHGQQQREAEHADLAQRVGRQDEAAVGVEEQSEPDEEPEHEHDEGQDVHAQDEVAGHPVGQLLDGRLAGLRVLDQLDDLGQRRVLAHLGGPEAEGAGLVERAADDLVARLSSPPAGSRR